MDYTHDDISELVAAYLYSIGALYVLIEGKRMGSTGERCDLIALFPSGITVVIEVKVSRSDFMADANKPHVAGDVRACGDYRFYASPAGLLETFDVEPRGYGYIEVHPDGSVTEALEAPKRHMVNRVVERDLLALMIERQHYAAKGTKTKKASPKSAVAKALKLIQAEPCSWNTSALMREVGATGSAGKFATSIERTKKAEQDPVSRCWQPVVQTN